MRRRRSKLGAALALVVALATPAHAGAQGGLAEDGALFLLLPVGARAVGMGQAVVADQPGSEAVWWNAAALARADKREVAIHHSQSLVGTGDATKVLDERQAIVVRYGLQPCGHGAAAGGVARAALLPQNADRVRRRRYAPLDR